MNCLGQFIFIISIIVFHAATSIPSDFQLELVFVIFRHGERVPEVNEAFPSEHYNVSFFYPMTYGEITKEGKRRQFTLGRKLRERYDAFLGPFYNADKVLMQSTNWDRTKMSALLTLAGLFPPHPSEVWNDELKWLPIPYHYKSADQDYLIQRPDPYCPRYMRELQRVFKTREVLEIVAKYKEVFDNVTRDSGREMFDFHEMFRVYQSIHAKAILNLTIPEWATKIYPEPLQTIASYQCVFENYNTLLKRLNGGHALQKFIEISKARINNTLVPPSRKMFLYSGHENNIVNILSVLDIYQQHIPPYCSAVMIELHKKVSTNQYGFKILYDNDTFASHSHEMIIPGCESFCLFDRFIELTKERVPINYTEECESSVFLD